MSKSQKGLSSFKELGEVYFAEHNKTLEKRELLLKFGVDIPEEELEDIVILESSALKIIYRRKSTSETFYINLHDSVFEKVSLGISCKKEDLSGVVEESFYAKIPKMPAVVTMSNPDNMLLSRAFVNVPTRYGDMCLQIEKDKNRKHISLYYGIVEECLSPEYNDFDFSRYCIFRISQDARMNRWNIGFLREVFDGPYMNIHSSNGISVKDDVVAESPIYAVTNRSTNDNGVILLDGSMSLIENLERGVPEFFYYHDRIVQEYEERECTSKAYFANPGECLALIKKNGVVSMECKKRVRGTNRWTTDLCFHLGASECREFSLDDLRMIVEVIDNFGESVSDRMKKFAIDGLNGYIESHDNDMNIRSELLLDNCDYDSFVGGMKTDDKACIVDEWLERLSLVFQISINEFLGEDPFAPEKYTEGGKRFLPASKPKK